MLDIGWAELMVIGVVALIVIGPKDLPDMFRQLGRFMAKIRNMGRDFQRAMDEAARQSGVNEVAKDLKGATSAKAMGLDGLRSAADKFEKWDPIKNAAKPSVRPLPSATITAPPVAMPVAFAPADPVIAAPARFPGPATQDLMDKQAAKATALRDYSAKLKAIDAGTMSPVGVTPPPEVPETAPAKPARKPRAKATTAEVTATEEKPVAKPRAERTKKADVA